MARQIDIVSLYPKDMNIYGDSGNVLTVERRLALYGYEPRIHAINQNDPWPDHADIILGGGGQDNGQRKIIEDLFRRADLLRSLAQDGVPMLMICGLYQLFGEYFETVDGSKLEGISIIGAYTVGRDVRMIGNLTETSEQFGRIVGYENHSGQTFLREHVRPLGSVDADGCGNNGEDHTEGAVVNHVIGTYMHGSLLPKNPAISDFLIRAAAERRYGTFPPEQSADMREPWPRYAHAETPPRRAAGRPQACRVGNDSRLNPGGIMTDNNTSNNTNMPDFGEGLRKIFLAGVGALAATAEKGQEIVNNLVARGELTVEQGKKLNSELAHKANEKSASLKEQAQEATQTVRDAAAGIKDQVQQTVKSVVDSDDDADSTPSDPANAGSAK